MLKLLFAILFIPQLCLLANSSFSAARIEEACVQYLKSRINNNIKVDFVNQISDLEFIEDDIEAIFELNGADIGMSTLKISFLKDNADVRKLNIPVRIYQTQQVAVANENLKLGDEIDRSKIRIENKFVDFRYSLDLKSIIGALSRKVIRAGEIITEDNIEFPSIIEKGKEVLINVKTASVIVKSRGKALNDAKVGEKVNIQREGSKKIITGVALADGSVIITK